jgi:cytochrome b561
MTLFGTRFHYGPVTQSFHWAMAVLVIAALVSAGASDGEGSSTLAVHEAIGVLIFALTVLRLTWRSFDRLPGKPPKGAGLALWSWRIDIALYVLLFAVPVTGIIGAQELPAMAVGAHPEQGIIDLHRAFGLLLFLTAGVHSALALVHQYVKRDGVLSMMLPHR